MKLFLQITMTETITCFYYDINDGKRYNVDVKVKKNASNQRFIRQVYRDEQTVHGKKNIFYPVFI